MSDLKLIIDSSDTEAAISKTVQLENKIKQLASRFSRGSADTATYNKGLLEIKRSYEKLGLSSQKATAEVRKYAKAQLESIKASEQRKLMGKFLEQEAKTAARLEEEYRKLSLSQKSARDSAKAMEAAFKAQEREQKDAARSTAELAKETERLRNKYNPTAAAANLYETTLREIKLAHERGAISAGLMVRQIQFLDKEYREFAAGSALASNRFMQATNANTRGVNNFGVQMQQFGYQAGDFIVQVQSGTNAFVAFGQQATQVAGTLTLLGGKYVAIGSALGILIPLTTAAAAAWMRVRQEQDQAGDSIETLEDKYQSLISTLKEYQSTQQALELGLSSGEFIAQRQLQVAQLELANARQALADVGPEDRAFQMVAGVMTEVDTLQVRQAKERISKAILEVDKANLIVLQNQAKVDAERVTSLYEEKKELEDRLALNQAILNYGEDSKQVAEVRRQQELESYANQVAQLDVTDKVKIALIESFKAVQETTSAVDALTNSTGNAADEALRYAEAMSRGFIGPGPQTMLPVTYGPVQGPNLPDPDKPSRGGGGRRQSLEDILKLRAEQIVQEERIARLSGETARIEEIKVEIQRQYGRELTATQAKAVEAAAADIASKEQTLKSLQDLKEQQESLASTIESSMEDAFMSIVDGTKSTEDAFKDMARSIIAQLYRVLVVQRLVGDVGKGTGLAGLLGNFLGFREAGGSVRSGGSYIVGERGPELFTPGRSGTITSNNLMKSGGQQEVAVRVYVDNDGNFQAMVDQRANKAIANAAPTIVNQSVGAVVERTKRGGSMKSTFK